jgi:hypothetical protein
VEGYTEIDTNYKGKVVKTLNIHVIKMKAKPKRKTSRNSTYIVIINEKRENEKKVS